ncbi:hypothetical protein [Maribacter sp. ACAM166]|uniref:hypothetical protein n=1 Tax=Maribacter sp. ACAM166 TaxID=2508996 RepID=UPI0010FF3693|nr:hypothetical protein [Maribacter sp. ACAM166]TLP75464.1 hypothetical protein ES765_15315 [Maribacter sp. ACAM166]
MPLSYFSSFYITAQSTNQVEDRLFKINALAPGVSYELGVGSKTSLNFEGFLIFALNGGSDRETDFGLYPGVGAEFRYFTNMNRRLGKGKNISGNSGNYLGLLNQFQFGQPIIGDLEYISEYFYSLAVIYGIQRTRPKGFYWGISFGPGVFVNEFDTNPGILIDARLGWVIGSIKK